MHFKNNSCKNSDFQVESLRNQAFLLERVHNLENLLLNSLQNWGTTRWAGWKLPIKTVTDMDAVELWLIDQCNYQEEVCNICID